MRPDNFCRDTFLKSMIVREDFRGFLTRGNGVRIGSHTTQKYSQGQW
jgi:hypothetical protein